jgi:hypothetical protein
MSFYYFSDAAGAPIGPVSETVLRKLLAARQIDAETPVMQQGEQAWRKLAAFIDVNIESPPVASAARSPAVGTLRDAQIDRDAKQTRRTYRTSCGNCGSYAENGASACTVCGSRFLFTEAAPANRDGPVRAAALSAWNAIRQLFSRR